MAYNACWPWTHATLDDWEPITEHSRRINLLLTCVQTTVLACAPIGVIGSILGLIALWRKAVRNKEHFFIFMFVIAVLELVFNSFYFFTSFVFGFLFPNLYQYSYSVTELSRWVGGVGGSASLEADMCTLVLTVERSVVLSSSTPNGQQEPKSKTTIIVASVLTTCITAVRFTVRCFQYQTIEAGLDEEGYMTYVVRFSVVSETVWFRVLIYISDIMLPFFLVFIMLCFSSKIAVVVYKRRKARIHGATSTHQQLSRQAHSMATLQLLFILVFLFLWNQIGYCMYAIAVLRFKRKTVSFDSRFSEIDGYAGALVNWCISNLISYVMECLARALNFYIYCRFSSSMREEFRKAIGCKRS